MGESSRSGSSLSFITQDSHLHLGEGTILDVVPFGEGHGGSLGRVLEETD